MIRLLRYLWALPNTLVGLALLVSALGSGRVRFNLGTLEAAGGALKWLLGPWADAITLGHIVLAKDADRLNYWREHEHCHVRQYEKWGPLFLPVYALLGCWCLLCGRHPYREHPFELAAGLQPTKRMEKSTA